MDADDVYGRLKGYGEIIIVMDSGRAHELHDGDTQYDRDAKTFEFVDHEGTRKLIDATKVEEVQEPASHTLD